MKDHRTARSNPTLEELADAVGFGRSHHHGLGACSDRRSFRQWLNDWAARESFAHRTAVWVIRQLLVRHSRLGMVISLFSASIGSGYLWAAANGDGLRGALSGQALDNAPSYPNANAAILGAVALTGAGLFSLALAALKPFGTNRFGRVLVGSSVAAALSGLALFEISQAIWHYQ